MGRWVSRDPLYDKGFLLISKIKIDDSFGLNRGVNLFDYVKNNPVNLFDLLGLTFEFEGYTTGHGYTTINGYTMTDDRSYMIFYEGIEYFTLPPTDPEVLRKMKCMADKLEEGFTVSEGTRPKNERPKGGALNSPHYYGKAIDVKTSGNKKYQDRILCAAAKCGFKRGQRYPHGQVHLDMEDLVGGSYGYDLPDPNSCECKEALKSK
jgi:hypothetical protein